MVKVIVINPQDRTITESEITNVHANQARLRAMQKIVGGLIEIALAEIEAPNGGLDDLFVNDSGLLPNFSHFQFFSFQGGQQLYAGPGFLVGTEIDDDGTLSDVHFTLDEVRARVRFFSRDEAIEFHRDMDGTRH